MLAGRVRSVPESLTLALSARAKALKAQGVDVVSFTAGELDFAPPASLVEATIEALRRGETRYTDSSGTPELRAAIADKLKRDNGLSYEARDIIVSCGAKHSIYNLVQVLADPGDEVLIPSPFWLSYADMARLAEAIPTHVDTATPDGGGFVLRPEALERAITPRTRVLILNSPGNPTGAVYGAAELAAIAEVVRRHPHLTVISDEIYEKLVYDGARHVSILEVAPDLRDRTVIVNGMSKSFAITGLRLGYAAGPREVIAAAGRLQSHSTSNPASIVQAGALAALRDRTDFIGPIRAELERRRGVMVAALSGLRGVSIQRPAGAFYCFPSIEGVIGRTLGGRKITDARSFSEVLLEKSNVVVVPGGPFGSERHVRLSFAVPISEIATGLERLALLFRETLQ